MHYTIDTLEKTKKPNFYQYHLYNYLISVVVYCSNSYSLFTIHFNVNITMKILEYF